MFNGPEEALAILRAMGESEQRKILDTIAKKDPKLAEFLEQNLVRFDDLIYLTPKMIGDLLRDVNSEELGLALRGSDKKLLTHFVDNVSKNMALDIVDGYGTKPRPISEVNEARAKIMKIVREKIEKGQIVINPAGTDEYV